MNILEKTKNALWILNIFFTIVLFVIAFKMATQTKEIPKSDNSKINGIIEKQNDLQGKIDSFKIVGDSLTEKIQNHETQKELISIYDQIDANAGNKRALTPLQGQFVREKANLEKLLAKLYDLGSEDSLIPLIKELYEAN